MLSYRRPAACPPEGGKTNRRAQQQRELSEPQTGDQGPPAAGQVGVQGAWSMRGWNSASGPQVGIGGGVVYTEDGAVTQQQVE